MCGRYTIRQPFSYIARELNLFVEAFDEEMERLAGRYNVSPTQTVPAIRVSASGALEAVGMKWGFAPPFPTKLLPINARDDKLIATSMWRKALGERRCALPVDGFYEWRRLDAKTKQPILFRRPDDEPFAFAGLYSDRGGLTTAHVTTTPNALVAPVHDRMPVMLDAAAARRWIDPAADVDELMSLLRPFNGPMTATPVSQRVNSPRNEGPELIEPAD